MVRATSLTPQENRSNETAGLPPLPSDLQSGNDPGRDPNNRSSASEVVIPTHILPPGMIAIDEQSLRTYIKTTARFERLMEISKTFNSTLDLNTLLERIIKAAIELTDTETASIMLVDQTTGELRFQVASAMSRGAMEALVVPKESLAGFVAQNNMPVIVNDVQNHPLFFKGVDQTVDYETRNMLAVPMSAHNKVIGVLEAINKVAGEVWNTSDMDTLSSLAAQAAIAVENARLFRQSDFVSEMVHELRTPLAALKASSALLLRPDLPEHRRRDITLTMSAETDRLSRLATDFLDLARLESGRTQLEHTDYAMRALIDESVDIVRQQAAEKSITILADADSHLHSRSDRGKVKQVLLNLLTNAIKYNKEKGDIFIVARSESSQTVNAGGTPTQMLRVSVRDTGYGISEDAQKHMFEKFYRVSDTAGFTTGTGLGLVIAKRIIEAHGGTIGFTSTHGIGTTFYFTLPMSNVSSVKRTTATIPAVG